MSLNKTYCITVNGVPAIIEELSDCFDVVFDYDSIMLQISKIDNGYKVTNAVNGWGNNCFKEYENAVVKIYVEQS